MSLRPLALAAALLLLAPDAAAADCIDVSCICADAPVATVLRTTVTEIDGPRTVVGVNEEVGDDGPIRPGDRLAIPRGEGDAVGRRVLVYMQGPDVIARVGLNERDEAVCEDNPDFALAEQEALLAARSTREECRSRLGANGYVPPPCPCGCASAGPEPLLAAVFLLASLRRRSR